MQQQDVIIKQAEQIFWKSLSKNVIPSKDDLAVAISKSEFFLQQQVMSDAWIEKNTEVLESYREKAKAFINILFIERKIRLPIIEAELKYQIPILRLSLIGVTGCVLGALFTHSLFSFFTISIFFNTLIGCSLGMFFLMFLSLKIPFLYKGKKTFDKAEYSIVLIKNIEEWMHTIRLIYELIINKLKDSDKKEADNQILVFVFDELTKIKSLVSKDDIQREISFIFQYLSNLGIVSDTKDDAVWNEKMSLFYETYGIIESGDAFYVESDAIIKNGVVIKKGLVRKKRK